MDARSLRHRTLVMCRRQALLFALLIAAAPIARAQPDLAELIELAAGEDEEVDVERLYDLASSPFDLNIAAATDLALLPVLSETSILALIRRRETDGPFTDHEQLRDVPGLSEREIEWLRVLTVIHPPEVRRRPETRIMARSRVTRRLELGRGYREGDRPRAYAGTPERHYQRLRVSRGRFDANVTLDKHPGERYAWAPQARQIGFDFSSFYLRWDAPTLAVRKIVIGDYSVGFGQGLGLGASLFLGKGREPVRGIGRTGRGVHEVGSSLREAYMRGAASTVSIGRMSVAGFLSSRYRSATIDTLVVDGVVVARARSIPTGELHRTALELSRRRSLRERLAGAAVEYRQGLSAVGVTLHHVAFDPPLRPAERDDLIPLAERAGHSVGSLYANVASRRASGFAEVAVQQYASRRPVAYIAGLSIRNDDLLEAVVVQRRFAVDFDNHLGSAFGHQSSRNRNESGTYIGLRSRVAPTLLLRGYVDVVRFPWMRFGQTMPTSLSEWMLGVDYEPRRWWASYLLVRRRVEESVRPGATELATRTTLRLHSDLTASDRWRFQFRIEALDPFEDPAGPRGLLLFQDVTHALTSSLSLSARLMLFDAADGARLYAYERDLTGAFGMISVGDRGTRSYILATYRPSPAISVQAKYGVTRYLDVTSIGSGNDEIEGNRLREIRLQVQITL